MLSARSFALRPLALILTQRRRMLLLFSLSSGLMFLYQGRREILYAHI